MWRVLRRPDGLARRGGCKRRAATAATATTTTTTVTATTAGTPGTPPGTLPIAPSIYSGAYALGYDDASMGRPVGVKPPWYGQPVYETHPHLLSQGELTRGIQTSEYAGRRKTLMDALEPGSVVISIGARVKYMSQGIFYPFRQATDFWYLTGFEEPMAALVMEKTSDAKGHRMTLFVDAQDESDELWNGARTGLDGAVSIFGADDALETTKLAGFLRRKLAGAKRVYIDLPGHNVKSMQAAPGRSSRRASIFDYLNPPANPLKLFRKKADYEAVVALFDGNDLGGRQTLALAPLIESMRLVKSPAEQLVMRTAGEISAKAHIKAIRATAPGMPESVIAALLSYEASLLGSTRPAYVPVIASGSNALTVHYTRNQAIMHAGETVLVDAGCELGGYASDITRTWPVSRCFTPPQRDIYSAVLAVQKACVKMCSASARTNLNEIHRESGRLLQEEIKNIGLQVSSQLLRRLYPHFVGHFLGIDLHDTPSIDRGVELQDGMVVTIEPGLYVPPDPSIDPMWHNIGIRIEDEILVKKDHYINLSVSVPKEVVDIEALRG